MIQILIEFLQALKRIVLRDRASRATAEQAEGRKVQAEVSADVDAIEAELRRDRSGGDGHAS